VPLEERLVERRSSPRPPFLPLELDNPVHEEERVTVGEALADFVDVENGDISLSTVSPFTFLLFRSSSSSFRILLRSSGSLAKTAGPLQVPCSTAGMPMRKEPSGASSKRPTWPDLHAVADLEVPAAPDCPRDTSFPSLYFRDADLGDPG